MTPEGLNARLVGVRDAGFAAPPDFWPLTGVVLQPALIGHHDPELRDDLIYTPLAGWIRSGVYSSSQPAADQLGCKLVGSQIVLNIGALRNRVMEAIAKERTPGLANAVVHRERTIYARGFGTT